MKIDGDCVNPFSDGISYTNLIKMHILVSLTNCVAGKMD